MNESDIIQIKTLKEEIRELKEKLKKMETLSGQVKSFDEFIALLRNALLNYKPKKKEQKDALKKLIDLYLFGIFGFYVIYYYSFFFLLLLIM